MSWMSSERLMYLKFMSYAQEEMSSTQDGTNIRIVNSTIMKCSKSKKLLGIKLNNS